MPPDGLPETIRYEAVTPGVRLLTIDRAARMNAIGPSESRGLFTALADFRDDDEAKVLVLTGAGSEAFCAGADLGAVAAMFTGEPATEPLFDPADPDSAPIPAEGNIGPTRWTDIHKPIIAAVNGAAYAGGLEWACFAHLRIADQHASFGVTCRRWNVGLGDGGTQRLPRLIGLSPALDLIITGRVIGSAEAERIGLVTEVVPSGTCRERALALAAEIAALPQPALRTDLEATIRGLGRPLEEGLAVEAECFNRLLGQPELASGARRFLDRDHPDRKADASPLHLPGKAFAFAERAHRGQSGKYGRGMFIDHPARVARLTADAGGDEVEVAAAYLHDVVEKADVSPPEIEESFGLEVRVLVDVLSHDPTIEDRDARKAEHRARVVADGPGARLVWLADRQAGVEAHLEALAAGLDAEELDTARRVGHWQLDFDAAVAAGLDPDQIREFRMALDRLSKAAGGA